MKITIISLMGLFSTCLANINQNPLQSVGLGLPLGQIDPVTLGKIVCAAFTLKSPSVEDHLRLCLFRRALKSCGIVFSNASPCFLKK